MTHGDEYALVTFIDARIDEDDRSADWCVNDVPEANLEKDSELATGWDEWGRRVGMLKPARIRAEVAFKRALVARLAVPDPHETGEPCPECLTLRQLAAVYAGHPDYRQEWAP